MAAHCSSINIYNCPPNSPSPLFFIEEKPVFIPGGPLILVLPSYSHMGTQTYRAEQSNPTTFPLHSLIHRDPPLSVPFPPLLIWPSDLAQHFSCCLATTAGKPYLRP